MKIIDIHVVVRHTICGWMIEIIDTSDHDKIPTNFVWNGTAFTWPRDMTGKTIIQSAGVSNDGIRRYGTRAELRAAVWRYNFENTYFRIIGGLH